MANIRVTPEQLTAQGNDLQNYGEHIMDIIAKIDAKISEIDGGWDGLAQDAFVNMYQEMKPTMNQFPELVKSLGQATVAAADAFGTVDEELRNNFSAN